MSDAFRTGRSRINPDLVAEIVRALGGDAERWRDRCVRAMSQARRAQAASAPVRIGVAAPAGGGGRTRTGMLTAVVIGGIVLNSAGRFLNPLVGDLLFLDMIGTAAAAILVGPWWAALVGVVFAAVELSKGDVGTALFASTMITAGLIWGWGVRRLDLGRTLPRFLGLSAVVALATTAIAVPITVLYFGGEVGRGADGFVSWAGGHTSLWAAAGASNLLLSLVDKLLTGAIAFFLARHIRRALGDFGAGRLLSGRPPRGD